MNDSVKRKRGGDNQMTLMKESNEKVYKIIGSCMEVHKIIGPGYPVESYKKALAVEFPEKGLKFEPDKTMQVLYKEVEVGTVVIDFLVEKDVVVIIRSQDMLNDIEIQKVLRCMNVSGSSIGVLVNFGNTKIQYKRVLPSYQQREIRKEPYRLPMSKEMGKTREGNPL